MKKFEIHRKQCLIADNFILIKINMLFGLVLNTDLWIRLTQQYLYIGNIILQETKWKEKLVDVAFITNI